MNRFYKQSVKHLFSLALLGAVVTLPVAAQSVSPQKAPGFFRVYPLELITPIRELRLGAEIGTAPKQSVVLDGSYFFGDGRGHGSGWALKTDYRFYAHDPDRSFRFFYGPNVMVKRGQYVNSWYAQDGRVKSRTTDPRTVLAANFKLGFDVRLGRKARFEYFGGLGVRYQSVAEGFSPGPGGGTESNVVTPNLLSGALIKF